MTIYDFLKELPNCFNEPQKVTFQEWIEEHSKVEFNEKNN